MNRDFYFLDANLTQSGNYEYCIIARHYDGGFSQMSEVFNINVNYKTNSMKNIINFFIITILFLSSFSSMIGQGSNPAFVHLPDLTGYPPPAQHLQDDLEDAATALRMVLDISYQADFAVYDLGFYAHHPKMVGGIPEVMAKAISDRITHSYYLLFGREIDDQGDLKKVWVELELHNTA